MEELKLIEGQLERHGCLICWRLRHYRFKLVSNDLRVYILDHRLQNFANNLLIFIAICLIFLRMHIKCNNRQNVGFRFAPNVLILPN